MNRVVLYCFLVTAITSCDHQRSNEFPECSTINKTGYFFPDLPVERQLTIQEINEYWNIPYGLLTCITTPNLIKSILDYPNINLIMAGSNPQYGYYSMIYLRFNGAQELERRQDRSTELVRAYSNTNPTGIDFLMNDTLKGDFQFRLFFLEIILSQINNISHLNKSEKIDLVRNARRVFEKKASRIEQYSVFGLAITSTVLARLMREDGYSPFIEVYDASLPQWEFVDFYWPARYKEVERVYSLSNDYLSHLSRTP